MVGDGLIFAHLLDVDAVAEAIDGTLLLLGAAIAGMAGYRARRRQKYTPGATRRPWSSNRFQAS
jgi:hypothetical protein